MLKCRFKNRNLYHKYQELETDILLMNVQDKGIGTRGQEEFYIATLVRILGGVERPCYLMIFQNNGKQN